MRLVVHVIYGLFSCNLILAKIKLVLKITNSLEAAADLRTPGSQAITNSVSTLPTAAKFASSKEEEICYTHTYSHIYFYLYEYAIWLTINSTTVLKSALIILLSYRLVILLARSHTKVHLQFYLHFNFILESTNKAIIKRLI